jgi:hypothetical protein
MGKIGLKSDGSKLKRIGENRASMSERRKEKRYIIPEIYRKYVTLRIRKDRGEFLLVDLLDCSPDGIKIRLPSLVPIDSPVECIISIPKSLSREIPFMARIKYCIQEEGEENYLIGAEIMQSGENLWLEIFWKTHDFIKGRMGDIY